MNSVLVLRVVWWPDSPILVMVYSIVILVEGLSSLEEVG